MRVALRTTDGVFHWLAGKPGISEREHSSADQFRIAADVAVQEVRKVRAAVASVIDRGNLKTTVSFTTVRKFATAAEAEVWSLDYDLTQPRTGLLVMESQQATGGVSRRYLPDVVIQPPGREVTGVSVHLSYQASGGAIQSSPPADLAIPI